MKNDNNLGNRKPRLCDFKNKECLKSNTKVEKKDSRSAQDSGKIGYYTMLRQTYN